MNEMRAMMATVDFRIETTESFQFLQGALSNE